MLKQVVVNLQVVFGLCTKTQSQLLFHQLLNPANIQQLKPTSKALITSFLKDTFNGNSKQQLQPLVQPPQLRLLRLHTALQVEPKAIIHKTGEQDLMASYVLIQEYHLLD